jgi:glyoxylase-like metal-dependent hydrolase (beta-lactamase superfamily II)
MRRRTFLRNTATLVGAFPLLNSFSHKVFGGDAHKLKVGKYSCTIIRDTMYKYQAKDFFSNATESEWSPLLSRYQVLADIIPSPFIALLVEHDDKKILIDTGAGDFLDGHLLLVLQEQGIQAEEITDVILTHFHPDHIGGVYSFDGDLNFPNARFHIHEEEWNFWHSSKSDNQAEIFKRCVAKNVTGLKDKNLNLVKGDFNEILPGITAVLIDGHTPGQLALVVQSNKDRILYSSDAFLHPIHIEKLDWETKYDIDHAKAKQSRIKMLDLALREDLLINSFHFTFPGLGRVEKNQNGYHWNYTDI